jgi:rhodanese-related sulfurtransferase
MTTLLIVAAILFFAWDLFWWAAKVEPISPGRLKKMLEAHEDARMLVDVRTSHEYDVFHIKGSESRPRLLLNPGDLNAEDRDKQIVVICMSGHRSAVVAYRLKKHGFRHVSYLAWGMMAWMITGGPTVRGKGRSR